MFGRQTSHSTMPNPDRSSDLRVRQVKLSFSAIGARVSSAMRITIFEALAKKYIFEIQFKDQSQICQRLNEHEM